MAPELDDGVVVLRVYRSHALLELADTNPDGYPDKNGFQT